MINFLQTIAPHIGNLASWLLGAAVALLSTTGLVAIIKFISDRPGNIAKARVQNVTAEVALGEGWKALQDKTNERFDKLEEGYRDEIRQLRDHVKELEDHIDQQERRHEQIIQKKDEEISKLKETNEILRDQNHILRNKLQAFMPGFGEHVEQVKRDNPAHLDDTIASITTSPHDEQLPRH